MKKELRGFICGVCLTSLLTGIVITASSVWDKIDVLRNDINIVVDGKGIVADNFLYNDTTYLPLRVVSEALGKDVQFSVDTNTAIISDKKEGENLKNENGNSPTDKMLTVADVNLYGIIPVTFNGGKYVSILSIKEKCEMLDDGYRYFAREVIAKEDFQYIGKISIEEYEKEGILPLKGKPPVSGEFKSTVATMKDGELISLEDYHRAIEPMIKALVEKQK